MTLLKKLRQNKNFRVFCFTTFNALIVLILALVANITDPNVLIFAPFLVAFLNAISKFINTVFFWDIWVESK